MFHNYYELVSGELERLAYLGWTIPPMGEDGVYLTQGVDCTKISFPSESYNPEVGNTETKNLWTKYRANRVLRILAKSNKRVLWEVGAGDGNIAIPLRKKGVAVIPIEPLTSGAESLARANFSPFCSTLEELRFPNDSIDAIGVFDVLEHIEHADQLVKEMYRVLAPGGLLLVTVPENEGLFSDYDIAVGHFRRYTRQSLNQLLLGGGFSSNVIEHMFAILVLPAFVLRTIPYKLGRRRSFMIIRKSSKTQNHIMKLFLPILTIVLRIEHFFKLPFGLSLISVSKK